MSPSAWEGAKGKARVVFVVPVVGTVPLRRQETVRPWEAEAGEAEREEGRHRWKP